MNLVGKVAATAASAAAYCATSVRSSNNNIGASTNTYNINVADGSTEGETSETHHIKVVTISVDRCGRESNNHTRLRVVRVGFKAAVKVAGDWIGWRFSGVPQRAKISI